MIRLRFILNAALLITCCGHVQSEGSDAAEQWPRTVLNGLQMPYLHTNERKEAAIHWLDPDKQTISVNGQTYLGFHFWSTIWVDGPVKWLLASSKPNDQPKPWLLIDGEGKQIATIEPEKLSLESHPRVVERFPQAAEITYGSTPPDVMKSRSHYYLIQPYDGNVDTRHAVILTIDSPRGLEEFGPLKLQSESTQDWESSDSVVAKAIEMRRTDGMEAVGKYLTRQIEQRMDHWEAGKRMKPYAEDRRERWRGWQSLYLSIYREAQVGGGRLDKQWAAHLYETLLLVTTHRRYYREMVDVTNNTILSLARTGRFGRRAELLEKWCDMMRASGYIMDPAAYPDRGSAFAFLPMVRKREIPIIVPMKNTRFGNLRPLTRPKNFKLTFSLFEQYSGTRWHAGHWREALEWDTWQLDYSSDMTDGEPLPNLANEWHGKISDLINRLNFLGYDEEALALCERALSAKYDGWYHGRFLIYHEKMRLNILMDLDRPIPNLIERLEELAVRAEGNMYLSGEGKSDIQVTLAKALIKSGRVNEGEDLLDRLASENIFQARWERMGHWLATDRVEGVESELIAMLQHLRESADKLGEISLYSMYADFLESQGRHNEALKIRRETIRLCRVFNLFTRLPIELAKLARLLQRIGDDSGASQTEEEARLLLQDASLPLRWGEKARAILDELRKPTAVTVETENPSVDFQPTQSLAIPIEGMPWSTLLTLTNPGGQARYGTLSASGLPATITLATAGSANISITLGAGKERAELPLQLEPGSYQLIAVTSEKPVEGEVTLLWTAKDSKENTSSKITVDPAEGGVTSAVIEAGEYRNNPFYGVPIHHHYTTKYASDLSQPLRFTASAPARIEVYDLDGGLLAIDSQGNGSLHDRGDELFAKSDGDGNLKLPLSGQSCLFMVLLYPEAPLDEKGLSLSIEAFDGKEWLLFSEDLLKP